LTVLFITFLSLVIGELVPKQLALNDPEKTILRVAGPMRVLSRLATPLVRLLDVSTRFVLRLIGVRPSDDPIVTEEEIKVMIDQGTRAGEFEETEQFLVRRVFRLADVNLEAVMTPRRDVVWLDADDPPEEVRRKVNASGRSRFPLAHGNLENVLGVVHAKDLLARSLAGEPFNLRQAMQPAMFVPSSLSALDMLQRFKTMGVRLALVIDEFGGLQGIVTMSDIMDEIIGGEFLTSETPEPHAVQREDGSWLLDGLMSIDEVKDVLNLRELPGEEDGDFTTLGGFMMHQFGRIPSASDQVNVGSLCFEVVDMDGHRVDKVLVRLVTPQPGENPEIDG
ncbi:MAG: HlyC/CorC family transporter, partial [Anaerolineae bacterium]|nr:HlyC/CorC family transporter [Anaerolineae bacterium]